MDLDAAWHLVTYAVQTLLLLILDLLWGVIS